MAFLYCVVNSIKKKEAVHVKYKVKRKESKKKSKKKSKKEVKERSQR